MCASVLPAGQTRSPWLLVVGLCAGTATAALAQNVDKPGDTSQGMTTFQKAGTTIPGKDDQGGMTNANKDGQPTSLKSGKHDNGADAFKKADKDNDGTLDKEEAKAMPRVAKNFDAIETRTKMARCPWTRFIPT